MRGSWHRALPIIAATVLLASCAANTVQSTDKLNRAAGAPRILLMPPDVMLYEVNAAGDLEPNALWTQAGERHLKQALAKHLTGLKAQYRDFQSPAETDPAFETTSQLQKLHAVIGQTIRAYALPPAIGLPGKDGKFDWSLGPAAAVLGQADDAQYALFLHVADSYASPGRRAAQFAAALFGVGLSGGMQTGHASLVDLQTGDVVWFNTLMRENGDLRDARSAQETVAALLTKLPR